MMKPVEASVEYQELEYVHQNLNANCEWPSSYRFPVDTEFFLDENDGQEAWDPEGICMVLMANDESGNTALPSEYRISNNYRIHLTQQLKWNSPCRLNLTLVFQSIH